MLLISDVHGQFHAYKSIIKRTGAKKSLQLGDFGLGFDPYVDDIDMSGFEGTHLFIRGNHDNPAVCRKSKIYAGDFGVLHGEFIDGLFDKLFFISGAWSIDQAYRTENVSWWKDEQLSQEELSNAVNLHLEEKPDIMCSHDCPTFILQKLHHQIIPTRTSQAMDVMFLNHKPSYWFFAHHHVSWRMNIEGCTFVCLNELECLDISKRIESGGNE
jgi:uncharacterized protein YutD